MITRWPLYLQPHVLFKKEEEGKGNVFIREARTCSETSVRLLFVCQRPELILWAPLTVRESERADISSNHFGIISKTEVFMVRRSNMDIMQVASSLCYIQHTINPPQIVLACRRHSISVQLDSSIMMPFCSRSPHLLLQEEPPN